ncbi:MAG TPA: hypothetical protein VFS08_15215 [Gemmatimonadaceae bacterium]|nr:hypothetical protein [Gemmatimonadaceae bacterium]
MRRATVITRWIVRLAGIVQIVLGLLFWTRHALSLIPVHMLVGTIVVLGLWTLAGLAVRAGAGAGLAVLAVALGIALPVVGMTQGRLLVGSLHWIIQVVHLLLGLGALRLAEGLAEVALRRGAVDGASGVRGAA